MQDFLNKKIVLGVTGGIAAYKSAYLVRELTRLGALVRVVMSASAEAFITPMTMQALSGFEVHTSLFNAETERAMGHIELARWADYLVIAPTSANCLAKMAHGLADDLLSTLYLATEAPVLVCPAMNRCMWEHPATQANCALLASRGVLVVGPDEGSQACGEQGYGRMSEAESIINALRLQSVHQLLKGRQVLVTAGPTREAIDPVRYITNHSSGKMGYALAAAAKMAGADVVLITGPTALTPPSGVEVYSVDSADAMFDAVMHHLKQGMIFIGTAAVADYKLASPAHQKIKKKDQAELTLHLIKNPDILATVVHSKKASFVIGFAAETTDVINQAKEKLRAKQVDMMIANQVGHGLGFDSCDNEVTVLTERGETALNRAHKTRLAAQIIAILATSLQNVAK